MFLVLTRKKLIITAAVVLFALVVSVYFLADMQPVVETSIQLSNELVTEFYSIFDLRNKAILEEDIETLGQLYDKTQKNSQWAFEHEVKKMKYLKNWSDKQGVKFIEINSDLLIRSLKDKGSSMVANITNCTEYKYAYEDNPEIINVLRIGTYHSMNITKKEEGWIINREWYTDPFADSLNLDNIKTEEFKNFILSRLPRDFAGINQRRLNAVEYADTYCGAAAGRENNFQYNPKYKDYNSLGGDCANFASQTLFEGGKFKKTRAWSYDRGGSRAWVSAQGFKDYMLNSGRASVIAYGDYNKVFKASFKLLPGDFVAYEKKGKVTHVSVVTGADSKGYSLVNCHNTDRCKVPWDLGWSDKGIKFWLIRVHF